jgi:glycosyltransferase involved in cell wall biosynthesis
MQVCVLSGTDQPELVSSDCIDGIPVKRILRDKQSTQQHVKFGWELFWYIFTHRYDYDILHSHGFLAPINLAAKVTGLPLVQKITGFCYDDPVAIKQRNFGRIQKYLYDKSTTLIATSDLLFKSNERGYKKIIRKIPNGVETEFFKPVEVRRKRYLRQKLQIPIHKNVLLYVGALKERKRLDLVIKSLEQLKHKHRDILLLVVGPIKLTDSYKQYNSSVAAYVEKVQNTIRKNNLENHVRFEGNRTNIHEYMQVADIFVHPSCKEGQPNALLEAMSSGMPCVVNHIPDITDELIDHEIHGFIIDFNKTEQVAIICSNLIENPDSRVKLGQYARERIIKKYSMDKISTEYFKLYQTILQEYNVGKLNKYGFKSMIKECR